MNARSSFVESRIRILRLALCEAFKAGDREAVKRLTSKLTAMLSGNRATFH
jgi:hypothetical protein